MKIHITGNAGSGKSTLANKLSEALELPAYSLDSIVWKAHWQKAMPEERRAAEYSLIAKPDWIIEGVSPLVRGAADCIIFLDYPRWSCYRRCVRRNIRYLFRSRPGLPDDCPEILIIPRLVQIIWQFQDKVKPAIEEQSESTTFCRLRTDREADGLVSALGQRTQDSNRQRFRQVLNAYNTVTR